MANRRRRTSESRANETFGHVVVDSAAAAAAQQQQRLALLSDCDNLNLEYKQVVKAMKGPVVVVHTIRTLLTWSQTPIEEAIVHSTGLLLAALFVLIFFQNRLCSRRNVVEEDV